MSTDRFVCKFLEERRMYPVIDILEAMDVVKQPHLLTVEKKEAKIDTDDQIQDISIRQIVAPLYLYNEFFK